MTQKVLHTAHKKVNDGGINRICIRIRLREKSFTFLRRSSCRRRNYQASQSLTLSSATETNMTLELLDIWQLEHVELAQ